MGIPKILDTAAAARVAYLLIQPIENTDAFRLGLINSDGKTVRKAKTSEEKKATNPLMRMVWNLKRIIGMIPGGKTKIGSAAATYLLMKEAIENEWSEETLTEQAILRFNELCESHTELEAHLDKLLEDAPVNAASGPAMSDSLEPAMRPKGKKPPVVSRAGNEKFGTGPTLNKASI